MTRSSTWLPWAAAALLLAGMMVAFGGEAQAAPPPMSRADIMCRVSSAVGYSYYWGGSCWCANGCSPGNCTKGSCSGNCPSCSHSGTYGADCSGLVNKVWQVPDTISTTTCGHGPYVAASYQSSTSNWTVISRSNIQEGDAMASSTHVLIYDHGDPWGQMVAYEARGCSYGIVHNWRSCSSSYNATRRANLISDCQCSPGQTETQACGNCGSRSRTCGGSCTWGAWSGCGGQGVCSPGAQETEPCCDCGTKSRSCTQACEWAGWSGCAGPDPGGVCATGEPGPCAEGTTRCVEGCSACVSDYTPTAEVCDAFDNDCTGVADDNDPSEMGETPPAYAARLLDASYPAQLEEGDEGEAWASFRNEGSATWKAGAIWLGSVAAQEMEASALYHDESWPAWDVAAVLKEDVEPGAVAMFSFLVQAPEEAGELMERFRLEDPDGALMQCPAPEMELTLRVGHAWENVEGGIADSAGGGGLEGTFSCSLGWRARAGGWDWLLASLLLGALRRRRSSRREGVVRAARWAALAWLALSACSSDSGTPAAPDDEVEPEGQPLLFVDQLAERAPAAMPVDGRRATAADLDGDGALDLLQPTSVGLLIHWGGASFASEQVLESEGLEQALAGDLDGDGLMEVLLLRAAEPHLLLLRQSGAQTFELDEELVVPEGVHALAGALFDLEGDGDLDVVLTTVTAPPAEEPSGGVELYVNDGSGVLTEEASVRLQAAELEPRDVAAGDVDGDGAVDLFFSGDGRDHRLLVSDGEGAFRDAAPDTLPSVSEPRGRLPLLGDLNDDGRLDVVVCSAERTLVWWGDPKGRLVDATEAVLGAAPIAAEHGAIADFDRDGHTDLVLASQAGSLRLYRNDGQGRLFDYSERLVPFGPVPSDAVSVTAADLDGDDDVDLFVSRAALAAPWLLVNWHPSASGDEDGDGVPDEVDNCPAEPNPDQLDQDASPFSCASGSDCAAATGCKLVLFAEQAAYLLCPDAASWDDARAFCKARGADLVVVGSAAENEFLASLELPASWIGLSDVDEEGTFVWVDGSALDEQAWADQEPNDSGGVEDCVTLTTGVDGLPSWNDLDCAAARPFLCEDSVRRTVVDGGDACDLCPLVPNPGQADSDDDGVGDACDVE